MRLDCCRLLHKLYQQLHAPGVVRPIPFFAGCRSRRLVGSTHHKSGGCPVKSWLTTHTPAHSTAQISSHNSWSRICGPPRGGRESAGNMQGLPSVRGHRNGCRTPLTYRWRVGLTTTPAIGFRLHLHCTINVNIITLCTFYH